VTTTVLAVDDSKTLRRVLEITFAGEEFRTILAENGGDALGKLARENPAVAVVDAQLGGESGYDLCQQLKERAPNLPVVLLSSKQQPFDRARGAGAGVDDFIDKPFDTQQLIDKVNAVVRRSAAGPLARPAAAPAAPVAPAAPAARPQPAGPRPVAPAPAPAAPAPARPAPGQFAPAARPAGSPPASAVPMTRPGMGPGPGGRPAQPAPAPAARPAAAPGPRPPSSPQAAPGAPAPQSVAAVRPPAASPAARGAPAPAAVPAAAHAPGGGPGAAVALPAGLATQLEQLGLTADQVRGVLALSREVVEKVVWEVVPVLAETLIKEEIERLTAE